MRASCPVQVEEGLDPLTAVLRYSFSPIQPQRLAYIKVRSTHRRSGLHMALMRSACPKLSCTIPSAGT